MYVDIMHVVYMQSAAPAVVQTLTGLSIASVVGLAVLAPAAEQVMEILL
jgi:hypothetical protein|tara:strand:- start:2049 stop:2195 length:147 start_codon:yes stop_codon:yes gene_type:complete